MKEEILKYWSYQAERFKVVWSGAMPSEYVVMARALLEILAEKGESLFVRYGSDGFPPEEWWAAEDTITPEESDAVANDDPDAGMCAHGAWLDTPTKKSSYEGSLGSLMVITPNDDPERTAKMLWKELMCHDGHGHIRGYLTGLGLQVPE